MKLRRRDQLLRANVLGMIEMVTMDSTNPIVMPSDNSAHAFVFPLETTFQKMARRPGGVSRRQALMNAHKEVRRLATQCHLSIAQNDT